MATLKEMARSRALKVGHLVIEFVTPGIGHMMKNAGCDFAFFDMEHSAFGYETIKQGIRYAEAAGVPSVVRAPSRVYHDISRALDCGAEGIMLPLVGSVAEAKSIIESVKYHPQGGRGVALGIAHDWYRGGPTLEKLAAANARTTIFMQIETAQGVEDADAIAALPEVDCLWIGHFDLSCSLGIPGQFENAKFTDAVAKIREACKRHGKSLGRLAPDAASGVALYEYGFDFISYAGDVWVYTAALNAGVGALKQGVAGKQSA